MEDDTFYLDLSTPVMISDADYRLCLVRDLVNELRKYTKVELIHEEILKEFELKQEIQMAENSARMYQQKADLLKEKLNAMLYKEDFE